MTTTEHLQLIKAECQRLLAIADKRTPGDWEYSLRMDHHDIIANDQICGGKYVASVTGESWGSIGCDEGVVNTTYIAACAGRAEAGWRATIAAIQMIITCGFYQSPLAKEILAAWPIEFLKL